MRLFQISVSNFRGIHTLTWTIRGQVNCLIGCGDSTKSTILDAIELVLSPRWNVPFVDADFYNCDHTQNIEIIGIVGDVPKALVREEKYGFYLRGWDTTQQAITDLDRGLEPVLVIKLQVDSSLEPEWAVLGSETQEPRQISSKDRELLGVSRLGEFIDRHVTWSRGSTLAKMDADSQTARTFIANAHREAIKAVRAMKETALHISAEEVEILAREIGVLPKAKYGPGLDSRSFGEGSTHLSLHDGDVPVRLCGLGSRRLLAAAIQKSVLKNDGAILVDEIEHGLEPHRIIHLIRTLSPKDDMASPQIFLTTHSPVAVAEVGATGLSMVKCAGGGRVTVENIPTDDDFAGLVRTHPSALLANKVIVCEGPTEGGLSWALDENKHPEGTSFGLLGVSVVDGKGNSQGPTSAIKLAKLGLSVAFFGDSDISPNPDQVTMETAKVKVFLWDGSMATEERIAFDLTLRGLQQLIDLARNYYTDDLLRLQIRNFLPPASKAFDLMVDTWIANGGDETALRRAVGLAAKDSKSRKGWFKRWDLAQELGQIVLTPTEMQGGTNPLQEKLESLAQWALS